MGGFSDQPYIYEPQNRRIAYPYSDFNPKAVTEASYQKLRNERSPEKKKKDGPLINFNQHPDSYMIVAGQNVNYKPMSPNTKKKVTIIRWIQFAFRILEEIGALGMLVAVICIKGMVTSMAWITRIAPAWDALITIYAIYHLARSPKARPPMSSASYHMFAIFMDVGVIPFYVFIGIFANQNYWLDPKNKERWTSFFTADGATDTLLFVTFIGAIVMSSFHAISTFFDLWLVILFRKIANLPPDLNPLEDNLTSRKSSKHQYKNSEATLTGSVDEKNSKYMSGSTLNVNEQSRLSTATKDMPEPRLVPFRHSRTGSELGYSPHNPDSARWSRQNMENNLYQQSQSARGSMPTVGHRDRTESINPANPGTFTMTETPPTPTLPNLSSRPTSYPNNEATRGAFNSNRFSAPALPNAAPTNAVVRSQQQSSLLPSNNWVALDDDEDDADLGRPDRVRGVYYDENTEPIERHDSFQPQPLKMNPPTPPPPSGNSYYSSDRQALGTRADNGNADLNRHLTVASNATASSSVYSESAPSLKTSKNLSPGTPKTKYYGDLAAATRGVRGAALAALQPTDRFRSNGTVDASGFDATGMSALSSYGYGYAEPELPPSPSKTKNKAFPKPERTLRGGPAYKSTETLKSNGTLDASEADSTGMSAMGSYGFCPSPPPKVPKLNRDRNGRVVSRSGVDLADGSQGVGSHGAPAERSGGGGGWRRREVSGKVAEEGRGGGGRWGWNRY